MNQIKKHQYNILFSTTYRSRNPTPQYIQINRLKTKKKSNFKNQNRNIPATHTSCHLEGLTQSRTLNQRVDKKLNAVRLRPRAYLYLLTFDKLMCELLHSGVLFVWGNIDFVSCIPHITGKREIQRIVFSSFPLTSP